MTAPAAYLTYKSSGLMTPTSPNESFAAKAPMTPDAAILTITDGDSHSSYGRFEALCMIYKALRIRVLTGSNQPECPAKKSRYPYVDCPKDSGLCAMLHSVELDDLFAAKANLGSTSGIDVAALSKPLTLDQGNTSV